MSPRSSSRVRHPAQGLALTLAVALTAPAAEAGTAVYGRISGIPAPAAGSAFDLHLAREDLELRYSDGTPGDPMEASRIGVSFYEPLGSGARMGVRLGRLGVSQSGRAATAAVDPTGYFIGLDLDASWPRQARLRASLGATWRYAVADASDEEDNETRLEWQAAELRPAVLLGLTRRVAARVGAAYTVIDGDERRRGPAANASTDFREDGRTSLFVALELYPAPDDVVTLRFRSDQAAGVYIGFEHRY